MKVFHTCLVLLSIALFAIIGSDAAVATTPSSLTVTTSAGAYAPVSTATVFTVTFTNADFKAMEVGDIITLTFAAAFANQATSVFSPVSGFTGTCTATHGAASTTVAAFTLATTGCSIASGATVTFTFTQTTAAAAVAQTQPTITVTTNTVSGVPRTTSAAFTATSTGIVIAGAVTPSLFTVTMAGGGIYAAVNAVSVYSVTFTNPDAAAIEVGDTITLTFGAGSFANQATSAFVPVSGFTGTCTATHGAASTTVAILTLATAGCSIASGATVVFTFTQTTAAAAAAQAQPTIAYTANTVTTPAKAACTAFTATSTGLVVGGAAVPSVFTATGVNGGLFASPTTPNTVLTISFTNADASAIEVGDTITVVYGATFFTNSASTTFTPVSGFTGTCTATHGAASTTTVIFTLATTGCSIASGATAVFTFVHTSTGAASATTKPTIAYTANTVTGPAKAASTAFASTATGLTIAAAATEPTVFTATVNGDTKIAMVSKAYTDFKVSFTNADPAGIEVGDTITLVYPGGFFDGTTAASTFTPVSGFTGTCTATFGATSATTVIVTLATAGCSCASGAACVFTFAATTGAAATAASFVTISYTTNTVSGATATASTTYGNTNGGLKLDPRLAVTDPTGAIPFVTNDSPFCISFASSVASATTATYVLGSIGSGISFDIIGTGYTMGTLTTPITCRATGAIGTVGCTGTAETAAASPTWTLTSYTASTSTLVLTSSQAFVASANIRLCFASTAFTLNTMHTFTADSVSAYTNLDTVPKTNSAIFSFHGVASNVFLRVPTGLIDGKVGVASATNQKLQLSFVPNVNLPVDAVVQVTLDNAQGAVSSSGLAKVSGFSSSADVSFVSATTTVFTFKISGTTDTASSTAHVVTLSDAVTLSGVDAALSVSVKLFASSSVVATDISLSGASDSSTDQIAIVAAEASANRGISVFSFSSTVPFAATTMTVGLASTNAGSTDVVVGTSWNIILGTASTKSWSCTASVDCAPGSMTPVATVTSTSTSGFSLSSVTYSSSTSTLSMTTAGVKLVAPWSVEFTITGGVAPLVPVAGVQFAHKIDGTNTQNSVTNTLSFAATFSDPVAFFLTGLQSVSSKFRVGFKSNVAISVGDQFAVSLASGFATAPAVTLVSGFGSSTITNSAATGGTAWTGELALADIAASTAIVFELAVTATPAAGAVVFDVGVSKLQNSLYCPLSEAASTANFAFDELTTAIAVYDTTTVSTVTWTSVSASLSSSTSLLLTYTSGGADTMTFVAFPADFTQTTVIDSVPAVVVKSGTSAATTLTVTATSYSSTHLLSVTHGAYSGAFQNSLTLTLASAAPRGSFTVYLWGNTGNHVKDISVNVGATLSTAVIPAFSDSSPGASSTTLTVGWTFTDSSGSYLLTSGDTITVVMTGWNAAGGVIATSPSVSAASGFSSVTVASSAWTSSTDTLVLTLGGSGSVTSGSAMTITVPVTTNAAAGSYTTSISTSKSHTELPTSVVVAGANSSVSAVLSSYKASTASVTATITFTTSTQIAIGDTITVSNNMGDTPTAAALGSGFGTTTVASTVLATTAITTATAAVSAGATVSIVLSGVNTPIAGTYQYCVQTTLAPTSVCTASFGIGEISSFSTPTINNANPGATNSVLTLTVTPTTLVTATSGTMTFHLVGFGTGVVSAPSVVSSVSNSLSTVVSPAYDSSTEMLTVTAGTAGIAAATAITLTVAVATNPVAGTYTFTAKTSTDPATVSAGGSLTLNAVLSSVSMSLSNAAAASTDTVLSVTFVSGGHIPSGSVITVVVTSWGATLDAAPTVTRVTGWGSAAVTASWVGSSNTLTLTTASASIDASTTLTFSVPVTMNSAVSGTYASTLSVSNASASLASTLAVTGSISSVAATISVSTAATASVVSVNFVDSSSIPIGGTITIGLASFGAGIVSSPTVGTSGFPSGFSTSNVVWNSSSNTLTITTAGVATVAASSLTVTIPVATNPAAGTYAVTVKSSMSTTAVAAATSIAIGGVQALTATLSNAVAASTTSVLTVQFTNSVALAIGGTITTVVTGFGDGITSSPSVSLSNFGSTTVTAAYASSSSTLVLTTAGASLGANVVSFTVAVATVPAAGDYVVTVATSAAPTVVSAPAVTVTGPTDCVGTFSDYGECSVTCGGGTQTRTFTETTAAANGGAACVSTPLSQECNTDSCTPTPTPTPTTTPTPTPTTTTPTPTPTTTTPTPTPTTITAADPTAPTTTSNVATNTATGGGAESSTVAGTQTLGGCEWGFATCARRATIINCANYNDVAASAISVKLVMGQFTDYFRPASTSNLCGLMATSFGGWYEHSVDGVNWTGGHRGDDSRLLGGGAPAQGRSAPVGPYWGTLVSGLPAGGCGHVDTTSGFACGRSFDISVSVIKAYAPYAHFDGFMKITGATYTDGRGNPSDANYVRKCGDYANVAPENMFVRITMGTFVDYFKPVTSLCTMMTVVGQWYWHSAGSATGPWAAVNGNHDALLGGWTPYGSDTRSTWGTFWGAPNAGGYYAEGGGCCYNSPTAAIQFWRAFKIDVMVQ